MKKSMILTAKTMLVALGLVFSLNTVLFAADGGCHLENGCGTNSSDIFNTSPYSEPSYAPSWSDVTTVTKVYGGQYLKFAVTEGNIYVWSTEGSEDSFNGVYSAACTADNQCGNDGKLKCIGGYCLLPFDTELTLLEGDSCSPNAPFLAFSNTDGFRNQSALEWKATFTGNVVLLITNYEYKAASGSFASCQKTPTSMTTTVKWQRSASEHCTTCDAAADYRKVVENGANEPASAPSWTTVQSKAWIDQNDLSAANLAKIADADANWIKPGSYLVFDVKQDEIYRWSTCVSEFYDTQLSLFKGEGTEGDCGQFLAYGDDSSVSYRYNDVNYCPAGTKQTVLEWQANFTGKVTLLFNEYNCFQCYKRSMAGYNNWAHCFEVTETYKKGADGKPQTGTDGFPVLADASTTAEESVTMTYMYAFPLDWQRYDCNTCTAGSAVAKIADYTTESSGWEDFATGGSQNLTAGQYVNFSLKRGSKYLFSASDPTALITIKAGVSCSGKTLAQGKGQLSYFANSSPVSDGADPNVNPDVITVFVSKAECTLGANTLTYAYYGGAEANVENRYTKQASGGAWTYTDTTTNLVFLDTGEWASTWRQAISKCEGYTIGSSDVVVPCPNTQCPSPSSKYTATESWQYCHHNDDVNCAAPVCGTGFKEYPKSDQTSEYQESWGMCYYDGDRCDLSGTMDVEDPTCVVKQGLKWVCPDGYTEYTPPVFGSTTKVCCKCDEGYTPNVKKVGLLKYIEGCVEAGGCSDYCVSKDGACSASAMAEDCPDGYELSNGVCYKNDADSYQIYSEATVTTPTLENVTANTTGTTSPSGLGCPDGTTMVDGLCQYENCGEFAYAAHFAGTGCGTTNPENCYFTQDPRTTCYKAASRSSDKAPCCCSRPIKKYGSSGNTQYTFDPLPYSTDGGVTRNDWTCPAQVGTCETGSYGEITERCYQCANESDVIFYYGYDYKCASCSPETDETCIDEVDQYSGEVTRKQYKCASGVPVKDGENWVCVSCPAGATPEKNEDDNTWICERECTGYEEDGVCYTNVIEPTERCAEGWIEDPQDSNKCRKLNGEHVECSDPSANFKDNGMSGAVYDGVTFNTCDIEHPNSVDCDCFKGRCETGYMDADKRVCPPIYRYNGTNFVVTPVYDENGFVKACKFTDADGNICGEAVGGWTLPNINQLYSLVDFDLYDPATALPFSGGVYIRIESSAASCAPTENDPFGDSACSGDGHYICMDGECVRNNWYWSSTTVVSENAANGEFVWTVNMQDGRSYRAVKGCSTTEECEADAGLNARPHKVLCVKGSSVSGIFDADAPSSSQTFSGWVCDKSEETKSLSIYFEIIDSSPAKKDVVALLGSSEFIDNIPGLPRKGIIYGATDITPTSADDPGKTAEIFNNCGFPANPAAHAFKVKWNGDIVEPEGRAGIAAVIMSIKDKECSDEVINKVYNGESADTTGCAVPPYFVTAYAVDPDEAAASAVAVAPTERPFVFVNRCGDAYQTYDGNYAENCERDNFGNVCAYGNNECQLCAREDMTVSGETVKACTNYNALPPSCMDGTIQSQYCGEDGFIVAGVVGAGLRCEFYDFLAASIPGSTEECDCAGGTYYEYTDADTFTCSKPLDARVCPEYYTGTGLDHCYICAGCKREKLLKARCGDGIVQKSTCPSGDTNCQTVSGANEECDDGNSSNTDSCTNNCTLPVCGDGYIQTELGEKCDSGSLNGYYATECEGSTSCPGCASMTCGKNGTDELGPRCGDGIVQNASRCSDAAFVSANNFENKVDCETKLANAHEVCDSGANNGKPISFSDFLAVSGNEDCADEINGIVQPLNAIHAKYAECVYRYKAYLTANPGCSADCKKAETTYCGDGDKGEGESCDEGLPTVTLNGSEYMIAEADSYNGKGYTHCKLDCSATYKCGDSIRETSACANKVNGFCPSVGEVSDSVIIYVAGAGEVCDAGTMNGTYGSCSDSCDGISFCGNGNKQTSTEQGDCIVKNSAGTCLQREECDFGFDNANKMNKSIEEAYSLNAEGSCISEDDVCKQSSDNWGDRLCCVFGRYCGDGIVDNGEGVGSTDSEGKITNRNEWRTAEKWALTNAGVETYDRELSLRFTLSGAEARAELNIDLPIDGGLRYIVEYDMMISKQGSESVTVKSGVNQYSEAGALLGSGSTFANASPYYMAENATVPYENGVWRHTKSNPIKGFAQGATYQWFTDTDHVKIVFDFTGAEGTVFYLRGLKFYTIESGNPISGGGGAEEMCDPGTDNFKTASNEYMTDCQAGCKWINYCGDGEIFAGIELCDNGTNQSNVYGGCEPGCLELGPHCGDGVLDHLSCSSIEGVTCNVPISGLADNEGCDAGALNSNDPLGAVFIADRNDYTKGTGATIRCRTNCRVPRCGDGILDNVVINNNGSTVKVEECDCGVPGSYYDETKSQTTEINGQTVSICLTTNDSGEEIPLYNTISGKRAAVCRPNCTISRCGDGIKDPDEECDDGNFDDHDSCTSECKLATCGGDNAHIFSFKRSYLCEELLGTKNSDGTWTGLTNLKMQDMKNKGVVDCDGEGQISCSELASTGESAIKTYASLKEQFEAGRLHCCYNMKIGGASTDDDHNCEFGSDSAGYKTPKEIAIERCKAYSYKKLTDGSYRLRTEEECESETDGLLNAKFSDIFERCESCTTADCGCSELFTPGSTNYNKCIDNNKYCDKTCWNRIGKCGDGRIDNGSTEGTINAGEQCDNLTPGEAGQYSLLDGNTRTGGSAGAGRYCTGDWVGSGAKTASAPMCDNTNTTNCWSQGCTVKSHEGTEAEQSRCGDGIVDVYAGEECDEEEGGTYENNWCSPNCRWNKKDGVQAACGDGVIQHKSGEYCDDGNLDDDDYCVNDCHTDYGSCGDGNITGPGYSSDPLYKYDCSRQDGCTEGPEDCDLKEVAKESGVCPSGTTMINEKCYKGDARSISLVKAGLGATTICTEGDCKKPVSATCGNNARNPRFEGCDCWTSGNQSETVCEAVLGQVSGVNVTTVCSKACKAEPVGQVFNFLPSKIHGWACDPDHPMTHRAKGEGGMVRVEFFKKNNTAMTAADYSGVYETTEDVPDTIRNDIVKICGGGSLFGWKMDPSTLGLDKANGPYTIKVYALSLDSTDGENDALIGEKTDFITAISCGDGLVSSCSDIPVILKDATESSQWQSGWTCCNETDSTCVGKQVKGNCSDYGLTNGEPCRSEACDTTSENSYFGNTGDCNATGPDKCQWTKCGDGILQKDALGGRIADDISHEECDGSDPKAKATCNTDALVVADVSGSTIGSEDAPCNTDCKWNRSSCTITSPCPALSTVVATWGGNYKPEKAGQYIKAVASGSNAAGYYKRNWNSETNSWPAPENVVTYNGTSGTQCWFECQDNLEWKNGKCVPKTGLKYGCSPCGDSNGVWILPGGNCTTTTKTIPKVVTIADNGDVVVTPNYSGDQAELEYSDTDNQYKCTWKCNSNSTHRKENEIDKCYPKAKDYPCKYSSSSASLPDNMQWIKVTKDESENIILGSRSDTLNIPQRIDENSNPVTYTPADTLLAAININGKTNETNNLLHYKGELDTDNPTRCFYTCKDGYYWNNKTEECSSNTGLCGNGQIDSEHCDTVGDTGGVSSCVFTPGAHELCDDGEDKGKYGYVEIGSEKKSRCDKYCGDYGQCMSANSNDASKCEFMKESGYNGRIAGGSEYFCGDKFVQYKSNETCTGVNCKAVTAGNYPGAILSNFSSSEQCDSGESNTRKKLCDRWLTMNGKQTNTSYYENASYVPDCSETCKINNISDTNYTEACGYCGDGTKNGSEECDGVLGCVGEATEYYKVIESKTWNFESSTSPYGRPAGITEISNHKFDVDWYEGNNSSVSTILFYYHNANSNYRTYYNKHNPDGNGWTRQTVGGHNAYCSTTKDKDKTMAELVLNIYTSKEGDISFKYYGSSEGSQHCEGDYAAKKFHDGLLVYLDKDEPTPSNYGQNMDLMLTGDCTSWRTFSKTVAPGNHKLVFRYLKDGGSGDTNDKFCIDDVTFKAFVIPAQDPSNLRCDSCQKSGTCYSYCGDGTVDNENLLYLKLDEGSGSTTANAGSLGGTYDLPGGTWYTTGKYKNTYLFSGTGLISTNVNTKSVSDNFTMMAWVKPTSYSITLPEQSNSGTNGTSGQRYVFGANHEGSASGAGVSVGTNGIFVTAHGDNYMPPLAVYSNTALNSTWNHVAVVFRDRKPYIYLNGTLVKEGEPSLRTVYIPKHIAGQESYGKFYGYLDEVRIIGRVLSVDEIKELMTENLFHEFCDSGSANNSDNWSQNAHCNGTCSGYAPHCGDGVMNGTEKCDGSDVTGYCYTSRTCDGGLCNGYYTCYDIYYYKCTGSCTLTKGSQYTSGASDYSSYTSTKCP